jgi:hypothetical protein
MTTYSTLQYYQELEQLSCLYTEIKELLKQEHDFNNIYEDLHHIQSIIKTYGLTPPLLELIDPHNTFHINTNNNKISPTDQSIVLESLEQSISILNKANSRKKLPIYIVITYTGSWMAQITKFVFNDKYTHSSISFDPTLQEMYSTRLGNIGVTTENLYKIMSNHNNHLAVYRLMVNSQVYNKIKDFLEKCVQGIIKVTYNIFGLIGILINRPIEYKDKFICSEFIIAVLQKHGIDLRINKPPPLIRPNDFTTGKYHFFKLIFTGSVNQFKKVDLTQIK